MKIVIFGAGAVGGYFGVRLVEAGVDEVVFIARGAHLEAMRDSGLRLESLKGDVTLPSVQATDDPSSVGAADAVLVGVKAWQVPEAAKAMRPMVSDETLVVPLQNGVEATTELAIEIGPARVLGGMCRMFASVPEPGLIRHSGNEPLLVIGELDNSRTERVKRFHQALNASPGFNAEIAPDVLITIWEKFLFVAPVGEVGAVTRAPLGVVRSTPESRRMLEQAMTEIEALARARGVHLPDDAVASAMAYADASPETATSSMHRDLVEGRRSELEAQTGAVVRLGRESRVPTPLHESLYASLLPAELRARGEITFPGAESNSE
jgi:2-dehydropantoate 2-reductase